MGLKRYTRSEPCPVCFGWAQEHGGSDRCHGFIGSDGKYAHCSRVGDELWRDGLYLHRLGAACNCGQPHDSSGCNGEHEIESSRPYDRDRLFHRILMRIVPPQGTPVETYMRETRGITVPLWPAAIAYDPIWCAMVAPIRRASALADRFPVGLHVTFLAVGDRVEAIKKRTYRREDATISGAGIWFGGGDERLCVAEGIEDALSAVELYGVPAVSAVSAAGIRKLELPPEVRRILLCADCDRAGRGACKAAAIRWRGEGREVTVRQSPDGEDLNDLIRRNGGQSRGRV
jgi:Toprim domain